MSDRDASLREAERLSLTHGSDDPYAAALRATRMPIAITDARIEDNPIVFVNDAFVALSGYARDEIVGRNCRFLQGPETDRAQVARIQAAIKARDNVTAEILNYRKNGSTFWNALYISPVFDDDGRVTHFFGSQLDVTERNRSAKDLLDANTALASAKASAEALVAQRTEALERALAQKTQLLHEIDHRVKNNLQLISSLILLQSRRIEDETTRLAMKAMLGRVSAIATVHRNLFQQGDAGSFDVPTFVRNIATDLVDASGREDISLSFDLEPLSVPAVSAAPVALIVNELVENALAHAFPERAGAIALSVKPRDDGHEIVVADDGVGRADAEPDGFGLSLVELLARQLLARIERNHAEPGLSVTVSLPKPRGADGADQ